MSYIIQRNTEAWPSTNEFLGWQLDLDSNTWVRATMGLAGNDDYEEESHKHNWLPYKPELSIDIEDGSILHVIDQYKQEWPMYGLGVRYVIGSNEIDIAVCMPWAEEQEGPVYEVTIEGSI